MSREASRSEATLEVAKPAPHERGRIACRDRRASNPLDQLQTGVTNEIDDAQMG